MFWPVLPAMDESMALQQQGSLSMSMVHITTKGHGNVWAAQAGPTTLLGSVGELVPVGMNTGEQNPSLMAAALGRVGLGNFLSSTVDLALVPQTGKSWPQGH